MAKKRKTRTPKIDRPDLEGFLDNLSLRDLKVQAISRGMNFELLTEYDILGLRSWLIRHFDKDQDRSLIRKYDDWVESYLKSRGVHYTLLDPCFRLSGTVDDTGKKTGGTNIKRLYKKKIKKPKSADGLVTGTKKYLVFELVKVGKNKEEILIKLQESFPSVNPKSVSNWYNRAKKKLSK